MEANIVDVRQDQSSYRKKKDTDTTVISHT